MIPMEYIIILVAWIIFCFGFIYKDYWIIMIAGFLLMSIGVYIIFTGLADTRDWITEALGIVHICIGGYVTIRSGYQQFKDD